MSLSQPAWQCNAFPRPGGAATPGLTLALALLLVSAGCAHLVSSRQTPPPPSTPRPEQRPAAEATEVQPAPPPGTLTRAELAEIRYLLDEGDRAIRRDQLTYPAKGSALDLYQEVLVLDPRNESAGRGLERIVERYLELAMQAASQEQYGEADTMLERARLVDPEHPGIEPVAIHVHRLASAERRVIALDGQKLRDRDPAAEKTLRQAGVASQADGCQARIIARNDSEGRWMYQRMSAAGGRSRIQAQLEIGTPPRIEVLCFAPGD